MKKVFAIIGMLFCFSQGNAQIFSGERLLNQPDIDNPRWTWGYFLGFNSYDYKFTYKEYVANPSIGKNLRVERGTGFNVGLVGSFKIHNNVDLRLEPGVSFNTGGIRPTYTSEIDEFNSTHVHIPLLVKFSANRLNNFRPFVLGGVATSINLSSNENNPDARIRMTTNNYYYELGVGVDLYFYYFKLSPSLRGVFAINDELVSGTSDMKNVDAMSTRAIFLNFTFQ